MVTMSLWCQALQLQVLSVAICSYIIHELWGQL